MAEITKQYLDYAGLSEVVSKIKGLIDDSEFSGAAADVTVADEAGHFTATNAEAALAELAVAIELLNDADATKAGTIAKMIADKVGELKIGDTTYSTVKGYVDALNAAVLKLIHGETGSLTDLTTTAKDNLVNAINEVDAAVKAVDYSGKADKVASATADNFAALDASGNLKDSGKKAADFEEAGAAAKVQGETTETVASVNAKVEGLGTASAADVATVAIETEGESTTALPTVGQVEAYVQAKVSGLTGAVHFRGIVAKLEDITDPKSGDMAIVGVKEYIYNGSAWQELGDEGAYVVKEDGKSLVADTDIAKLEAIAVSEAGGVASVTDGTNNLKISSIPLTGENSIAKLFE